MEGDVRCHWRVHSCSSQAEVHEAANVLKNELYRVWQTAQPTDEAWLVLEACPPSAFSGLEIVNAGSALLEVFGLPEDKICGDDRQYTMLLSAQQLMTTKDVINKANRNRSFTYSCSDKLSQLATQQRWKCVKVSCRQPFGSEEHKTCIGLARLNFNLCKTSAEAAADSAAAHLQQNLKAGMARMFPKGSSNAEGEVLSQVTGPSKHQVEYQGLRGGGEGEAGNISPPRVKRRLPVWQSPSKHMKKEAKVEADHGALSDEEGAEISQGTKSSHKEKPKSRVRKPERKEEATVAGDKGPSPVSGRQKSKEVPEDKGTSPVSARQKSRESPGEKGTSPVSARQKSKESPGDKGTSPVSAGQKSKEASAESHKSSEACKSKGRPHQLAKSPSSHSAKVSGQSSRSPKPADAKQHSKGQSSQKRDFSEQGSPTAYEPSQANAITDSFSKFLDGVVFAISGLVNPERADVRDKALQMGGQYRPDWSSDCTLLICAFSNTPKFNQVKNDNGTIVSKVWIQECYQQKKLVEIEEYLMHAGNPWRKTEASATDEFNEETNLRCDESMTLGSLRDLQQWVSEDVGRSITWLKQKEIQPEAWELESVAIQGIELCLDDAIGCIKSKQSIKKTMEKWEYVPRAVQELVGREDKAGNVKKKNFWSDMLSEAERLRWVYSTELEKIRQRKGSMAGSHGAQKRVVDEDTDTDDDATDTMSADAPSDDTRVLDEEGIRDAEEAISRLLSRQHRK